MTRFIKIGFKPKSLSRHFNKNLINIFHMKKMLCPFMFGLKISRPILLEFYLEWLT